MNFHGPDNNTPQPGSSRRQHHDTLVLLELNPLVVVDRLDSEDVPLTLLTFGSVREVCPRCQNTHLKLVLRQASVRMAHLFCDGCESCFDARYRDGAPALTI